MIALLGETRDDLAASEYAQTVLGLSTDQIIANGTVPRIDLEQEKSVQNTLLKLADECLLHSAHDCSDGGLAVAIVECCFSSLGRDAIGADIILDQNGLSNEALLFGETPSRIVISFAAGDLDRVKLLSDGCPLQIIGKTGGANLQIKAPGVDLTSPVTELESLWKNVLRDQLETLETPERIV